MHNYGYTLLRIKNKFIRILYQVLEMLSIKFLADYVLCVSDAMKRDLQKKWKIKSVEVLYDKPNDKIFKKLTMEEKNDFFNDFIDFQNESGNIITKVDDDKITYRINRPLLLLSNSSFSVDDDYNKLV